MPRPGPRPYECIRRAWHSDSHQPLRGSLIQEIFRVVNDLHNPSTRRKKEWQDKVPIVVLRAEEILYSKANSESEYMDAKTLRHRLEDAVNTMIRREQNDEDGSGPYLEPCVEAALSLGCLPKTACRGQRQGLPRYCANGRRRTSSNCFAVGAQLSKSGCNSDVPFYLNYGLTHGSGTTSVFNTSISPVVPRQKTGQGSAFYGSSNPVFEEADTQSFNACYTLDGQVICPLDGDFFKVDEHCMPMTGPSYLDPQSSGLLKMLELGQNGSVPCAPTLNSTFEILPDTSSEEIYLEDAATNIKFDSGLTGMDLFSSPATINPVVLPSTLPQLLGFKSDICSKEDKCFDTQRCKPSVSQVHFSVGPAVQISQSVSDKMCSNGTSSQTGEAQGSMSCKPSPFRYDETACSSTRVPSKEMASVASTSSEKDCASSYDLQLRLGPPGTEQKPNGRGDIMDEFVPTCGSAPRVIPCEQRDLGDNMKAALPVFDTNPQMCYLVSYPNRGIESFHSMKGASYFGPSRSSNVEEHVAKRIRGGAHRLSNCGGGLQIVSEESALQLGWSRS